MFDAKKWLIWESCGDWEVSRIDRAVFNSVDCTACTWTSLSLSRPAFILYLASFHSFVSSHLTCIIAIERQQGSRTCFIWYLYLFLYLYLYSYVHISTHIYVHVYTWTHMHVHIPHTYIHLAIQMFILVILYYINTNLILSILYAFACIYGTHIYLHMHQKYTMLTPS